MVTLTGRRGLPRIDILFHYLAKETSLAEIASEMAAALEAALTDFELLSERGLHITPDMPAYEMVYTWTEADIQGKARFIFVTRGSQSFAIRALSTREDYDRNRETIDQIMLSFRLEEPRPFGISRLQALTLYDTGPITLDPALSRDASSHAYIVQLFSGLVAFDKDLNLIPDIAQDWELSPEGTTYTFYLRPGVSFHDGRPVTAWDFKYSWERACHPETGSQTAADFLGDIVGVSDVIAGRAREISGVEVVNDYTLKVTIDAPKTYFLAKLSYPVAFVVDRHNVTAGEEWWRHPNGTGPFQLMEWQEDQLIILKRNDHYHREPAKVQYVIFRLWGGVPIWMYETDEIDVASVSIIDIERVRDETNPLHQDLVITPMLSVEFIGFNVTKPPFDDASIRRAFAMAVDRDRLIETVLKDMVEPAQGLLPPGLPGHNPEVRGIDYDPTQARELIAAKYGDISNFPPITLTAAGYGTAPSPVIVALIQGWRENLGVEVQVKQIDPEKWAYVIKEEKDELVDFGWIADYPDPHTFLDLLFHSQSQANDMEYSNPELDALLEQARIEQDTQRRWELYREAEQLLIDDAACIPLWFGKSHLLVKPYVKGWVLTPQGLPLLSLVSLEPH